MPSQSVSHAYVEVRLSPYIDGRLPEEERAQVRRHLKTCQECRSNLNSLGWTVQLLKELPVPALPRQFTLPVPQAKPATSPWLKWGLTTASALAVVAFISIVSVGLLERQGATSQVAMPAAAAPQHTLVAAVAPTSAPPALDRAAAPSVSPSTELRNLVPTATSAPPATETPAQILRAQNAIEPSPTEPSPPLVSKAAPSTLPCQGCGGGTGGEPTVEPQGPSMFTAPSHMSMTGTIKDALVTVWDSPSDAGLEIGTLDRGSVVQVLDRDGTSNWLRVSFPIGNEEGLYGWVESTSIILSVPFDTLPTAQPPTETPTVPNSMIETTPEATEALPSVTEEATPAPSATPIHLASPSETMTKDTPSATPTARATITPRGSSTLETSAA